MAWTIADQAKKNIEDAKKGLFGDASQAVIEKNEQVLRNLSGEGSPKYVGTGSSYDDNIKKASENNPMRSSSTYSTNQYRTSQYNTENSSGQTLRCEIIDNGGYSVIVIKPDGSSISVARTSLSKFVDASGNWIYNECRPTSFIESIIPAGVELPDFSAGGVNKGLLYTGLGLLAIFLLRR